MSGDKTPSSANDSHKEDSADAFGAGLSIEHLNPPEIRAFFGGLHRRAVDYLSPLDRRAPVDELTQRLNAMADRGEALVERLRSVGYPIDTSADAGPPAADEQTDTDPDPALAGPLERIEAASTEIAKRLAGIPSAVWRSGDQVLQPSRTAVAEIAATLRSLGPAVAAANQQVPSDGGSPDPG